MIKTIHMSKSFDGFQALDELDMNIKKGSIYGLIGTNGAGKTTLIKHIADVLKPDFGKVEIDGEPVLENIGVKKRIGYIPDDLYFFATYHLKDSRRLYRSLYPNWNEERYARMVKQFALNETQRLSKFSKGMQKQAAFILTMSHMPDYLILDEPIDGLDPIVRKLVWKYVVEDVAERDMTVLISSHNLREMEGICDCIGILSQGKMLIERDLDELKSDTHKIQVAFPNAPENVYEDLHVLHKESRGTVDLLIVKDKREKIEAVIEKNHPLLFDLLPLTLEEIFIHELGGDNNEIQNILF